jgi:hypothetical protein
MKNCKMCGEKGVLITELKCEKCGYNYITSEYDDIDPDDYIDQETGEDI